MLREPSYVENEYSEPRDLGKSPQILKKVWPYLRRYPRSLYGSLFAVLIASLTVLGIGTGLKYFVDYGFSAGAPSGLLTSILILFGVVLVMALASYCRLYWVSKLSERVIGDLRRDIFSHLLHQDVNFFENTSLGEIQSRLTTDTTLLQIVLGTSIPIAIRNTLIIIGGVAMLMLTSSRLTAVITVIIPFVLIPLLLYGKKVRTYSRLAQEETAQVSTRLDETFGAIRTVFAFCQESYMSTLFSKQVERTFNASLLRVKARAQLTAGVMVLVFGGVAIVLWYGGGIVLRGHMTPGELSAFIFYAAAVAGAAGSLSEIHGDILRAAGGVERVFEFLAMTPTLHIKEKLKPLPAPLQGHLQFTNVGFAYPSRPHHKVLNDISFEARKGETIALVGPSGVGKTTIFNLLMRFYDPLEGKILLDGISIDDFSVHNLRQAIGLVPQDPVLFSTTILENIRFGKQSATDEEIIKAAKAAYADEFIDTLPLKYNTHVGEKGVTLSGGQKQRIAIARAIIKNPTILLLDEATSALDSTSELMVQKALESLKPDRTTLIIAHRKSTIESADRQIVFNEGKISH